MTNFERSKLYAKKLVKVYRKRTVVKGIDIEVNRGEIVGLLGPNGAGKTTTFYMITGFIKPKSGQVLLDEDEITSLPMYRRARMGIGYLPQEQSVFRKLTVEQNLMAILEMQNLKSSERKERCHELLDELDISHLAKNKAFTLSGGERRRAEIARAMVTEPKFMLLDEPFSGIDPITIEEIKKIIYRLKEKGLGVLITDHNVRDTLSITDRGYIIFEGEILKKGTAEFLANDPEAKRIYLGEKFRLN
ncbi:MAG: LPS export ABC transporter ATP-binding protein [candidate division Zixibacteria bacterium]|nr:LPS export ABC transporter ATP-binding protein [candidate division Zixibacteria bacterium]